MIEQIIKKSEKEKAKVNKWDAKDLGALYTRGYNYIN